MGGKCILSLKGKKSIFREMDTRSRKGKDSDRAMAASLLCT